MTRLIHAAGLCVCIVCCTGCRLLFKGAEKPHADGKWVGRIVPVQVESHRGDALPAAALEVESGPPSPVEVPEVFGSGKRPLLVNFDGVKASIILPAELPMGRRVRIRGTSVRMTAAYPQGPMDSTVLLYRASTNPEDRALGEHVLIVRDEPIVLKEE